MLVFRIKIRSKLWINVMNSVNYNQCHSTLSTLSLVLILIVIINVLPLYLTYPSNFGFLLTLTKTIHIRRSKELLFMEFV